MDIDVGAVLSSILILSLYAFPMSFAETWAFGEPRKIDRRGAEQPVEDESSDNGDLDFGKVWSGISERLPGRMQNLSRVSAGLTAGGCLMVVVAAAGALVFALFYHFSGRSDMVNQVIPMFAYWFPFALLGMVTDMPFQIVYWEDTRIRVLLRLVIWWFPRVVIFAFVFDPPFLRNLDPASTALTVLAIDALLVAFCLGLYAVREQTQTQSHDPADRIGDNRL